jgi:hypothetical protein
VIPEPFIVSQEGGGLFQQLLAQSYHALPLPVQQIHHDVPFISLRGYCTITRGINPLSRLMALCARLPPEGDNVPVHVTIERESGLERWVRRFGKHEMPSTLTMANGLLHEALGLARFLFRLEGSHDGIKWVPVAVKAAGIPLPTGLFRFSVYERAENDRYQFDVRVDVFGAGLLVHYRGWLERDV